MTSKSPGDWNEWAHFVLRAIEGMDKRFESLENKLDDTYVSRREFWPVRVIVYTGAGTVLLAVLGAVVAAVVKAAQ